MKCNKIFIFYNKPPFKIKTRGLILNETNDKILYITEDSIVTTVHTNFFFKQLVLNTYITSNEKRRWFYIIKKYIDSEHIYNINKNNMLYIAEVLHKFAPYKRRKYIVSKMLNIYKKAECPICYENRKMVKLHNSNHYVCIACFIRIDKCPICRAELY